MSGISHNQAIQLIDRRLDGLLNESQLLSLEEHLRSCDECGTYASEMELLPLHLRHEFHTRWDKKPGPSQQIIEHVTTKARNIPVTNRISSGIKLFAGAMALILLGVAINFVVSRLQSTSTLTNATKTVETLPLPQERLLSFESDQNGNFDIYTMHADGTGLTNLTNNPARDSNPVWSPDGKYIAFESDRDGFVQIYRMDADGSNVFQLTREEADHRLPLNRNDTHNPWAPDGSRLLFLQEGAGKDMNTLYSIDINGENQITLANGRISLYDVSWSPGGQHIAYLLDISPTKDKYVPNLYVVEPDGSNDRELKKLLPAEKQSDIIYSYYWSSNGQSIFLPASATDSLGEAIYQLDLQTNTVLNETETKLIVTDWREGGSLIQDVNQEGMPYVWERSDGTSNTFEASKAWDTTYDPSIASAAPCSLDVTRSTQNNFAFGVYCPDAKFNLYWTNSDGSIIKQLLTLPTDVDAGGVGEIAWSPDDQYMAFNITSADKTEMYVVNVEEFLASPSNQPLHVSVNNGKGTGIPSWQPVINEDLTKELPTPHPTLTSSLGGLLAFASDQNGNLDIYTMGADGSGLTNLTNNPAWDSNPTWSPDGKRIAFESDRDGFTQIYWMNADGSDVVQLTHNNQASHFLPMNIHGESNPWSPDGSKLLFLEETDSKSWILNSLDIMSGNITKLATGQVQFNDISWSPDGKHIGYVLNDSPTPESTFVIGIYVVDPTGDNLIAIKDLLPQTDKLDSPAYYWSKDGSSIIFTTYRHLNEGSDQWIAYEYVLDSQQLMERATSSQRMEDWWQGTSFIGGNMSTLTWLRSDGTSNTFKPLEACQTTGDGPYGFMMRRSPNGSQVINSYCPNAEMWFYYANSDGTIIKPLVNSPIPSFTVDNSATNMTWSSDDQFIAVTLVAPKKSSLYILNVKEPAAQPQEIVISNGELYEAPSWQPITNENSVKEIPTPQPILTSSGGLLAFVSEQNGNPDIYTMHSDGSGLINITNHPADDANPVWSPDGGHIAFISNRDNNDNIYVMNADGSELIRLTDDPAPDRTPVWSPDGTKIAYSSGDPSKEATNIYVVDSNGQNRHRITDNVSTTMVWPAIWSQDNQFIFFDLGQQIMKVNVNDGDIKPVTPQGDIPYQFTLSKDGSNLQYLVDCNQNTYDFCNRVKIINSDGTNEQVLDTMKIPEVCPVKQTSTWMGSYTKWSPDQTKILFAFTCEENGWLYIADADGSDFKPLTNYPILGNGPQNEVVTFDWSPDNQSVVFMSALDSPESDSLYILNVDDALQNPEIRPTKLNTSISQILSLAWQPIP